MDVLPVLRPKHERPGGRRGKTEDIRLMAVLMAALMQAFVCWLLRFAQAMWKLDRFDEVSRK